MQAGYKSWDASEPTVDGKTTLSLQHGNLY